MTPDAVSRELSDLRDIPGTTVFTAELARKGIT